ncbi:unnamed protein product [Anisakis simplex]|uniref:Cyclic di-GMP-binding protein n=1 Tax=Anisakis simplex TaxID=6269 RepID=A0A0M3JI14_ANISI|nr:unnamed protein product [Anisakis simplex]
MLRDRPETTLIQFRIGPLTFEGIRTLDGDSHLRPNSSFSAQWIVRPVQNSRLTRVERYQVSPAVGNFLYSLMLLNRSIVRRNSMQKVVVVK